MSHPLFATTPPSSDDEENDLWSALKTLQAEENPDDRATHYRDSGNVCFSEGKLRYNDALGYYTLGISEKSSNKSLNSILYSNRAMVQLKKGNFGKALKDSTKSIEQDPTNIKAYYRGSFAAMQLNKLDQALDLCRQGIALSSENPPNLKQLRSLLAQIKSKQEELKKKERAETDRERAVEKSAEQQKLDIYKERGIKWEPASDFAIPGEPGPSYTVNLDGVFSWRVVFLYPEFSSSDLIPDFCENNTLGEMLEAMFVDHADPLYTKDKLAVFVEKESGGKFKKMPQDVPLGLVLSKHVEVVKNHPVFYVLSTASPFYEKWRSDPSRNC